MAVARSYENMEIIGEPFDRDGKKYVKVRGNCTRCGGSGHYSYNQIDGTRCYGCGGSGVSTMTVRWYTDNQRAAMDRAAEKRAAARVEKQAERAIKYSQRNTLGFGDTGYITLYKGADESFYEWLQEHPIDTQGHLAAWYNTLFHWFTPSKIAVPSELPEGVTTITLTWDEVKSDEVTMKPAEEVQKYLDSILEEPSLSEYQGEVGKWMELPLTVTKRIELDGKYGVSSMHILEDENENVYVWTTGSKTLKVGKTYNMKVKVKEHKQYKNVKQTIIWYCKIK